MPALNLPEAAQGDLFRHLANSMAQFVWVTDLEGKVAYLNSRWYQYTGQPETPNFNTRIWDDVVHPEDYPLVRQAHLRSLSDRTPFEVEYRVRRHDGLYRWHLARTVFIEDGTGKPRWRVGTATDIDDQKRAVEEERRAKEMLESSEARLKKAYQDAKEAVAIRDHFLSVASHELRTPITSMLLQAQLMKKRAKLEPKDSPMNSGPMARFIDLTDRSLARLARLIDEMLDVSRIQLGKLHLQRAEFDLSDLMEEIVDRFHAQLEHEKMSVRRDFEAGLFGRWDRDRIDQVLTNLIMNAIRYAPQAPLHLKTSRLQKDGREFARIEVKDEGPGISKEYQSRIFDRFERASGEDGGKGLGLGLYLSRELVLAHGGTIAVESEIGQGTRFIVELPTALE